ncbi:MAG: hypothetical protein N838_02905 [Thiohalocapsa sp. PB-PSB1]|nr:MAG: hypothetical protein N838_02905 [Thiohalocapsa sp. PB-PSB1]
MKTAGRAANAWVKVKKAPRTLSCSTYAFEFDCIMLEGCPGTDDMSKRALTHDMNNQ